jgi:nucleotide-binding universal stress UspA family protein
MKILIGTDLSEESLVAARQGFAMARRLESASVYVAYVEGQGPWYPQATTTTILEDPDNRRRIEREVKKFLGEHLGEDLDYELVLEEGRAEQKLPEIARRVEADWLYVGMTGHGRLARLVVGSTAEKLAHQPPCNLAIAHPRGFDWQGRPELLAGIDFSEASQKSMHLAIDLAAQTGARLHIVNVVFPPGPVVLPNGLTGYAGGDYQQVTRVRARAVQEMKSVLEERSDELGELDWTSEVLTGYPTRELIGYAEDHDVDGIVLGTVGRSALDNFLLGGVARGVVKHMPCTVFLSPPAS